MIKLYGADNSELMAIAALEPDDDGKALLIKGKIYGAMPLTARLYPEDARAFLKMLTPRLAWFLFTMLFKAAVKSSK
ncbi:MAG: hypothetical protein H6978_09060 [Gammaproteobacteria bacterium]|nr:hypothetical protein [Gammaproteobacteria bacterium]